MKKPQQDFFHKTQTKSWFSGGVIRTPQSKGWSRIWIILSLLIIIAGGAFYLYLKQNTFQPDISTSIQETGHSQSYLIWAEIQKEGILKEDTSDMITYTHTLTSTDGETFFLKSKKIPLNNYTSQLSGVFQIIGTIESIYKGTPLVEVETIGTQTTELTPHSATTEEQEPLSNPGIYINNAGLYFDQNFFENFAFVGQAGANNSIEIKNLENEKITKIEYFTCTQTWETNCKELTRVFKDTSAATSTNSYGDTFYKLSEVQTWYFQNNNRWGYFINNADDTEVEKIKNLITIASPEYIKSLITLYWVKTCLGIDNGMNKISSHELKKTEKGIEVTMQGNGEKQFSCQAILDPTQPNKFQFLDIKITEIQKEWQDNLSGNTSSLSNPEESKQEKSESNTENTWNTATTTGHQIATTQTTNYNPNVKQFPISTEKNLTYNSSRGQYSIIFPSMNIAYEAKSTDQDFDQAWVRCSYAINIIQYKNKEHLHIEPTLTIYECSTKNDFTPPAENFLIKELGEKKFILQIHDGAWLDFANATKIQTL